MVLIHELLHSIDARIPEAARFVDLPKNAMRAAKLAMTHKTPRDLGDTDRAFLETWVRSGLDRGLWSEYRAWVATVEIYGEGLVLGLWGRISWLEDLVARCPLEQDFNTCFYALLDGRAPNPAKGLLAEPLIAEVLKQERSRARAHLPPPM